MFSARGIPQPQYQWHKNGVDIPNANRSTLPLTRVTRDQCGTYVCTIRNRHGTLNTLPAVLAIASTKPVISTQPQSVAVAYGSEAQLFVVGMW